MASAVVIFVSVLIARNNHSFHNVFIFTTAIASALQHSIVYMFSSFVII